MKINLFIKYLVCYLIIVVSSLIILNTVGIKRIKDSIINNRLTAMKKEAETITDNYMRGYYSGDMSLFYIGNNLKTIDIFANARILIVNRNGYIISDTRNDVKNEERQLPDWFIAQDSYIGSELSMISENEILSVISPIDIDFELKGYVIIIMEMSEIESDAAYSIDTLNIGFLLLGATFFIALAFLYRISIVPLRAVIEAAREYAKGKFDYKLQVNRKRHDEFKELIDAIEYMASELSLMEENQRKFISNISHDFRSPLTSIKGFAVAMKDGTIPPEFYDKYLNTICFETDRLTKLTTELIELGKLDNKKTGLNPEKFDLNKIIKMTVTAFEERCRERHISINLIFESNEFMVSADKSKIEQVFYNLIDNGIKFSYNDSFINITVKSKGNKAIISVKDFGIGISRENIKKIWERFYKIDSSRGKDKGGSGLGLSIVKEIIKLHGESINVVSTENAGTEFIFTLNRAEE